MTQNGLVECQTLYGKIKLVPTDDLNFRPSAYGVILHEGKILLLKAKATGKWLVPGGGINKGESLEDGLRREIREETGIEVDIERFAMFSERFFYYDPREYAMQVYAFFYICRPRTFDLATEDEIEDDEAEKPQWVDFESLTAESIQAFKDELATIREMMMQDRK